MPTYPTWVQFGIRDLHIILLRENWGNMAILFLCKKGKVILLQVRCGPEGE